MKRIRRIMMKFEIICPIPQANPVRVIKSNERASYMSKQIT
ncbi:hypothetical protein [Paenibacillus amylolyticus]|nr:hypothetical protein [Paenibacillus amylolyticus]WFA84596.1 hypothetical protein OGI70_27300 [Paenibacillus amylolyticus]